MQTGNDVQFRIDEEKAELNQYWYSPHTISAIVAEVRHHATACAFLSTPSLYFALLRDPAGEDGTATAAALAADSRLFEFDRQWEADPGFVRYDFHRPEQVPVQYLAAFDYVLADPPFITEDVWTAYVQTAKLLLRPGGRLLFTTVLENHTMLEGLLDAPLFIAPFRPAITHLTYQYVCFTNYSATRLARVNSELPPEDPKIMAATQMANELRESEQEFTAQARQRDRQGEAPLPAAQHHDTPSDALADLPISAMKWGYIPAGLTVYADGGEAPPAESGNRDYGSVYREIEALRVMLDNFKRLIDLSQKHLDRLLRLQQRCGRQEGEEASSAAEAALLAAKEAFAKALGEMREIVTSVESSEACVAAESGAAAAASSYVAAMKECVEAYATVPLQKQRLNELAADATRKFKSPVFNRMKELLQRLKEIKRQHQQEPTPPLTMAADATPSS
ncbi:methyltransferase [Trypanosoma conorhini]|uniref:Methyltransferase n=1 Tax=Trypanosoma conorhini TaxID=83891 RepID=A0A422Q9L8_9TRYP|nr:methyltransferase [Trypanosoma conorhini]RNF26660.1 methyltransferase [Trypanosoma conorhini]